MTNRERLISLLGFSPSNVNNLMDGALVDAEIDGTDTYVLDNSVGIKTALLSILKIIYSTPDVTTSTSGITTSSLKYDRQNLWKRISDLETELGLTEGPKVTFIRPW